MKVLGRMLLGCVWLTLLSSANAAVVPLDPPAQDPLAQGPPAQGPPAQGPPVPGAAAVQAGPGATKSGAAMVRGQLRTLYYGRWTGDSSDNDLVSTLSVDVGSAEKHGLTAHLMGRVTYDMDGRDGTFASLNDSYGQSLDGLLYDAYVDLHRVRGLSLVRLGRQSVYETPEVAFFDGGHATSQEIGDLSVQFGGYLGASTHLYESSRAGDLTAGAYAQARPWSNGRVRLDYMHLEDQTRLRSHDDDLIGAGLWQNFGKQLQFDAQYSRIGNRDRDVLGRAIYRASEWGLLLQASYFALLRTQGSLVLEADPFFNSLNELRPYNQWSVLASKELGEMLELQAAADLRRLRDRTDAGFYNRDYDHYYGTANLSDFGVAGLSFSGTVDFWDSDNQLLRSWGGDASYERDRTTVSIGTYYSLYKFDLFSNSERDHVRTYYCKLRHKVSTAITLEGNYELEDNDLDQFHLLRLGMTWRF